MELKDILAISGKSGLHKQVKQMKNGILVESLDTGKRFPVHQVANIVSMADIAIYTDADLVHMNEVFLAIRKKEEGESVSPASISDKDAAMAYFAEILPNYDRDRVHMSEIKKIVKWYNELLKHDLLHLVETPTEEVKQNV